MNNLRDDFISFAEQNNVPGSNKAASYIKALDDLSKMFKNNETPVVNPNFWAYRKPEDVDNLYDYILKQQRLSKTNQDSILDYIGKPGYAKYHFYSAALKEYKKFLGVCRHEDKLWGLVGDENNPRKVADKIENAVFEDSRMFGKGETVLREVSARINQHFFRRMILVNYSCACCVSGLNVPQVLRASHITPWAEDETNRLNPTNGLCLSAVYDAAFDRHLISFDDEYKMILSPRLKEYYTNGAFKTVFLNYQGKRISLPKKFLPSEKFLSKHRNALLK